MCCLQPVGDTMAVAANASKLTVKYRAAVANLTLAAVNIWVLNSAWLVTRISQVSFPELKYTYLIH